jgi:hypothetical protein
MATEEEIKAQETLNEAQREGNTLAQENFLFQQNIGNEIREQLKALKSTEATRKSISSIVNVASKLASEIASYNKDNLGTQKDLLTIDKQINQAKAAELILEIQLLSATGKLKTALEGQLAALKDSQDRLEGMAEASKEVANNTGVRSFSGLKDFVKSIPGLKAFSGPFEDAAEAARDVAAKGGTGTEAMAAGAAKLKKVGLNAIFISVLSKLLEINKSQTEFRRLTGQSVSQMDALNDSLATANQFMEQTVSLTNQFGFNAAAAFDAINIQEATELSQLMGLTAEEANQFALFSQAAGENANVNTNELIKQVGELNVANKSAVSQKIIFQDIGKISKATALTFQGSAVAIGKAAANARALGLNLEQVDKIAGSLLDIEQSISAEFEAEVISGRQLNLEQARYFALTNDLEGLTSELAKNQSALQGFVNGTRIEQEAIAGALGMSREEMADMVFQQRAQLDITDEQARKTAGLSEEDFKRLTIQESINNSLSKLTEILAGPLELFVNMLGVVSAIGKGIGFFVEGIKSVGIILGPIVAIMNAAAIKAKAIAIFTAIQGAWQSLSAVPGIGAALAAAAAATAVGYIKSQKADDLMSGYGQRTLLAPEGTFALNNNDTVIAGTNLGGGRGGRNQGLSKEDVSAIATAVRDGASSAQINLDGGRVSNRIQPPLAMNTRKYSV